MWVEPIIYSIYVVALSPTYDSLTAFTEYKHMHRHVRTTNSSLHIWGAHIIIPLH